MPISLHQRLLEKFGLDARTKFIKAQHKKLYEYSFFETLKTREGKLIISEFYKCRGKMGRHSDFRELWHNYDFCYTLIDNPHLLKCIDIRRNLFNRSKTLYRDFKQAVTLDYAVDYFLCDSCDARLKLYLNDWSIFIINQMELTDFYKELRVELEGKRGELFVIMNKCYSILIKF